MLCAHLHTTQKISISDMFDISSAAKTPECITSEIPICVSFLLTAFNKYITVWLSIVY